MANGGHGASLTQPFGMRLAQVAGWWSLAHDMYAAEMAKRSSRRSRGLWGLGLEVPFDQA